MEIRMEPNNKARQADASFLLKTLSPVVADGPLRFVREEGLKMGKCSNDAPGMKGCRSRNEHGPLRGKRGDTFMGTIEDQYGRDFGVRSNMHLDTYLKRKGLDSLNDLITGQ